jgi:hypothetical protein
MSESLRVASGILVSRRAGRDVDATLQNVQLVRDATQFMSSCIASYANPDPSVR